MPRKMENGGVDDDERLRFASLLDAGDALTLVRADGPLVDAVVTAIDGVDLELRPTAGELPEGALASLRIHAGDAAWFATLIVLESEPALARARIGDALQVTSERWTERIELGGPVVIRPESGLDAVVRGECLNASLTGVAVRLAVAPPPGSTLGVTLPGDGEGSVAFRGRVARVARASRGSIVGIELIGISRDDHRRLGRLIARKSTQAG
jgi:hypothetical protein